MAKFTSLFILGVAAVTLSVVSALTDEEKQNVRAAVTPLAEACAAEFGITKDDIIAAKQAKNPDALNACFYRCVLNKIGSINDQGLYDPVVAKAAHKKYIKGETDLAQLDSITDICTKVNDQAVSDGAQGCERSKLLVHCLIENKSSFTPLSS